MIASFLALAWACSPPSLPQPGGTAPGSAPTGNWTPPTGQAVPGWSAAAPPRESVPGDPGPDALWDEEAVPTFHLELPPQSIAALEDDPFTYVVGTFTWGDLRVERVGVRTKGNQSWRPITEKPSLKVKFDAFVDGGNLLGLHELTLNAMNSDYSQVHERVAYRFYREAGVPAARCHHAWLVLNDQDYGLYANVETITAEMIAPWFDPSGSMFELFGAEFEAAYLDGFELEFGPDDRSLLEATAEALEAPGAVGLDAADAFLDLDAFLRYWAASVVVGQYDAYPYRYPGDDSHVYADPVGGRLVFLPHGVDETFYEPDKPPTDGVVALLGTRCLEDRDCTARWEALLDAYLDLAVDIDLLGYARAVQEQVAPLVEADPRREFDTDTVAAYQASMLDMIANRRADVSANMRW